MSDLKKKLDKGIAYLKRNGVRKTICRAGRKAVLSREVSYEAWLKGHVADEKELERQKKAVAEHPVKVAIWLFPAAGPGSSTLESLMCQSAGRFPIFTARELQQQTEAVGWKKAEYVLLIREGTQLRPEAVYEMTKEAAKQKRSAVLYTDHDVVGTDGHLKNPFCKPDYDPVWQKQQNYMGSVLLVERTIAEALERWLLVQEPDFILAGTEKFWRALLNQAVQSAKDVIHLPALLYHVSEILETEMAELSSVPPIDGRKRNPLLSVIIPNKDHIEDLRLCVKSLLDQGEYESLEILIVENNSEEKATFQGYEEMKKADERIRLLNWSGVFNYSAINNDAVKKAHGEYLLFLNNDTQIKEPGALWELMDCIQREKAGAVGARLFYGDLTIQHAGVVLGYGGIAGHAFEGMSQIEYENLRYAKVIRQMSAVTAACMLVDRRAFEQIGGFTEKLGVAYNDIDLCMKLRKAGWTILYDPAAQMYHYESQTRGFEMNTEKAERVKREAEYFCQTWKEELHRGDPFYNASLTLEKSDFSLKR
ncbi:MAG: glycosyltransferase family 2 protein [Lachnospiraceae bacterium]